MVNYGEAGAGCGPDPAALGGVIDGMDTPPFMARHSPFLLHCLLSEHQQKTALHGSAVDYFRFVPKAY